MKIIKKHLEKNKQGYLKLIPEDADDIWQLYNLIDAGDLVQASTFRYMHRYDMQFL